jgi:hypothetical protein
MGISDMAQIVSLRDLPYVLRHLLKGSPKPFKETMTKILRGLQGERYLVAQRFVFSQIE